MDKKEMLDRINAKVEEVKGLVAENKLEEAKKAKEELEELQNKFDLIKDLDDERPMNAKPVGNTVASMETAFVNAIRAGANKEPIREEDQEILNQMSEGSDPDGGLTVPQDISTKINEYRRAEDALENEVNVERVTTIKGSRVFEVLADQTPFDNVDEAAEFPEVDTPTFKQIGYEIKKKGGILKVTRELLKDSAENIMAHLMKWIGKKEKATRNFLILKKVEEITEGKEVEIAGIDDLKDVFNVKLDPAISVNAKAITNQDGFGWLDKLKDSDGRYLIQPDPTKATPGLLFGKYPIRTVSNKTMKTKDGKAPIILGDLKEAVTIFDREHTSIEISDVAGDLWRKDLVGIKVRDRLDIQAIDEDAVIMGRIPVTMTRDSSKKTYTQEELEAMTVDQIETLAGGLGYTLTGSTKADKIASFLTAQGE